MHLHTKVRQEMLERIFRAMLDMYQAFSGQKISDKHYEIWMKYAEGKSYSEIGAETGLSDERVRVILLNRIKKFEGFDTDVYKELDDAKEKITSLERELAFYRYQEGKAKPQKNEDGELDSFLLQYCKVSSRLRNVIVCLNLKTLDDLSRITQRDLEKIPNCGKGTIEEAKALLAKHGMHLADPHIESYLNGMSI